MMFRFKVRLLSAIVAHRNDCLRIRPFALLDETLAHSADDVEMSFVCAHTNISRADCRLDCVVGNSTVARLRRRLTGEDHTGPLHRIALDRFDRRTASEVESCTLCESRRVVIKCGI